MTIILGAPEYLVVLVVLWLAATFQWPRLRLESPHLEHSNLQMLAGAYSRHMDLTCQVVMMVDKI